jgi:hypothetical protein
MTENVQETSNIDSQDHVASGANVQNSTLEEKVLTQSEVNELIGREKKNTFDKAYQKGRAEALSEPKPQQHSLNEEVIAKRISDEVEKKLTEERNRVTGEQIVYQFMDKLQQGAAKHSDFEEKVMALDLTKIPETWTLANQFENTADIMYELANNPSKIGMLRALPPHLAQLEMKKLSDSLKSNQEAKLRQTENEPLSQLSPSKSGIDSGDRPSIASLRRNPRYRG